MLALQNVNMVHGANGVAALRPVVAEKISEQESVSVPKELKNLLARILVSAKVNPSKKTIAILTSHAHLNVSGVPIGRNGDHVQLHAVLEHSLAKRNANAKIQMNAMVAKVFLLPSSKIVQLRCAHAGEIGTHGQAVRITAELLLKNETGNACVANLAMVQMSRVLVVKTKTSNRLHVRVKLACGTAGENGVAAWVV